MMIYATVQSTFIIKPTNFDPKGDIIINIHTKIYNLAHNKMLNGCYSVIYTGSRQNLVAKMPKDQSWLLLQMNSDHSSATVSLTFE